MKPPLALIATAAVLAATSACVASLDRLVEPPPTVQTLRAPALNHIYVVVDAETFAALRDNAELAALLGRTDGGLPDYAPPAAGADRIFFRGRQTYLEVFAPENRFDEPVGKVGIGLGYDAPKEFDALEIAWNDHCGATARRTPVTWRRTEPPTPWYDAIQCDDTAVGSELALWAMVYRPEFQRWQRNAPAGAPSLTARADILAPRAAAGQGRFDIAAVTLSLSPTLRDRLIAQLVAAGFSRKDGQGRVHLLGDGLELRFFERADATGLVSVEFDLTSTASASLSLGRFILVAAGPGRAILSTSATDHR